MHYGSVPFDMNTLRRGYPTTDNGFCLTPNVTQGRSRGTVRLRSRDFRDRPRVDPRYFTDPEGYDDRIMLTGVRLARTIAEQAPLASWVARELAPGPDATTDDELLDYVHKMPQHRVPPGGNGADGCRQRSDGGPRSAAARQGHLPVAGRRRFGDAETAVGQPQHHGDDDGGEVCRPHPAELIPVSRPSWASTRRSRRCPTTSSSDLAAESELVDFPAGAIVADYATRVPDDVWMVRAGQVTLQASADGTTIDTVEPRRHLRLHPAAHRRRNGIRGEGHGRRAP